MDLVKEERNLDLTKMESIPHIQKINMLKLMLDNLMDKLMGIILCGYRDLILYILSPYN